MNDYFIAIKPSNMFEGNSIWAILSATETVLCLSFSFSISFSVYLTRAPVLRARTGCVKLMIKTTKYRV